MLLCGSIDNSQAPSQAVIKLLFQVKKKKRKKNLGPEFCKCWGGGEGTTALFSLYHFKRPVVPSFTEGEN